jgi:F0F1-type ATP synthase epsilon subunit
MNNKDQAIKKVQELIPIYKLNKSEADSYKKLSDKYNAEIKAIMVENGLTEVSTDDVKITCGKQVRQSFIEESLIETLKKLKVKNVIKKKEYVDMDALENAIYNGEINAASLAPCQSTQEVITLRLSAVKK